MGLSVAAAATLGQGSTGLCQQRWLLPAGPLCSKEAAGSWRSVGGGRGQDGQGGDENPCRGKTCHKFVMHFEAISLGPVSNLDTIFLIILGLVAMNTYTELYTVYRRVEPNPIHVYNNDGHEKTRAQSREQIK